ncbi:MAG: hypothetical protein COS62_03860 [Zetaproteobacteria bacterium CG03_land_8_20_14_0_80_59_51]|nr:MAG: hypothetical protein AUK36_03610 [Zetaproteobacteria bacterium CG2_30_59_37]PIO89921.1 MAG: hypothetical protein COX56_05980 [Zetaproteobacteria bacterium CG23_combo_of_CG06-09_8_20_14_all_59_86]PIU97509.1 MAG: hypothetical protein COS62_03860 [Zetaproteobacteria bacterium CG03_land_8_20_14_0_80_59_51]PJC17291.1 MAG: hypothetical protein CO062_07440 [Zetaproteobacteria bacterium CG_4_9_14_0_2_um_filter_59_191]
MVASIKDGLYVQSTMGVLPEAVSKMYEQEQSAPVDEFPLSRGAVRADAGGNAQGEDEAIFGDMEVSALAEARRMAGTLDGVETPDKETFAGYMATILIEMGGEAIMEGGKKSAGVLKNVSSLLSKTDLVEYRKQLPASVLEKLDADKQAVLAAEGIAWLKEIVAASNERLPHGREDTAENKKLLKPINVPEQGRKPDDDEDEEVVGEGMGISYAQFGNRIEELLAGNRDRLYEEQLEEQDSGLDPEDSRKGAASGKEREGVRTKAIPFEVRGPRRSTRMEGGDLSGYAEKVMTRVRTVNDPFDDQSAEREAELAAERRAEICADLRKVADAYADQTAISFMGNDRFENIDEANSVTLGQCLSNVVLGYWNQLNQAEQADFDQLTAGRYGGQFGQYLFDGHNGEFSFNVFRAEIQWLKEGFGEVTSKVRALEAPQAFASPEKEMPVAREAAEFSLELAAKAAPLGAFWRAKMVGAFGGDDCEAYVRKHAQGIDFSGSVQVISEGMQRFKAESLGKVDICLKGQQVAKAIEDKALLRYHALGDRQDRYWSEVVQKRYPAGYDTFVADHVGDMSVSSEDIVAALEELRTLEATELEREDF